MGNKINLIEAYKNRYNVKNSSGNKEINFEQPTIRLTLHRKSVFEQNITEHFYINNLEDIRGFLHYFCITDFLDMLTDDWEVIDEHN